MITHYERVGNSYIALNSRNDAVGVISCLDDTLMGQMLERLKMAPTQSSEVSREGGAKE